MGLRRECSLVATSFEGQWSALPTSAHSRGDGSLTGQGLDSVVAEPDKLSMDKLECWVWDQVYTLDAIPVLSLAMCMVIDVVFPVNEKKISSELLGWSVDRESFGSAWCGEASCGLAVRSSTEVGMPGSSNAASKVAARNF